jgi:hypothetical protein
MLCFFFLAFIYMPFEASNKYSNLLIERRLPLLGFGVVGLLGVNHLYKFKYFLYTFVFTSVVSIAYIFFKLDLTEFIPEAIAPIYLLKQSESL